MRALHSISVRFCLLTCVWLSSLALDFILSMVREYCPPILTCSRQLLSMSVPSAETSKDTQSGLSLDTGASQSVEPTAQTVSRTEHKATVQKHCWATAQNCPGKKIYFASRQILTLLKGNLLDSVLEVGRNCLNPKFWVTLVFMDKKF